MVEKNIIETIPKFKFKKDSYAQRRGSPAMLIMNCAACHGYVMTYQKDGPGPLIRCYLDRIHHPENIRCLHSKCQTKNACPPLVCDSCKILIGIPIVYEKEDRLAYFLKPGNFKIKKIY